MTTEEINIVIAESSGWHPHPDNDKRKQKFWTYGGGGYGLPNGCAKRKAANPPIDDGAWENILGLPDYCNDLNAIHEAENTFKNLIQQFFYAEYLGDCHSFEKGEYPTFRFVNSTAKLRAIAFLKTIGKWEK